MLAVLVGASGCGGDGAGEGEPDPAAAARPPGVPAPGACAADALRTSARPDDLVPAPGAYVYAVDGSRRTAGGEGGRGPLPRTLRVLVTRAREAGNVRCFTIHRPYAPQLVDNATFAVRGGDVHLTRLETITAGRVQTIEPDPPIKFLDGDDVEWSGSFGGPTRGRYEGSIIGRRSIRVGGRPQRAVGVEVRIATSGDARGSTATRAWYASDSNVVLQEETRQQRGQGVTVDFDMRLRGGRAGG